MIGGWGQRHPGPERRPSHCLLPGTEGLGLGWGPGMLHPKGQQGARAQVGRVAGCVGTGLQCAEGQASVQKPIAMLQALQEAARGCGHRLPCQGLGAAPSCGILEADSRGSQGGWRRGSPPFFRDPSLPQPQLVPGPPPVAQSCGGFAQALSKASQLLGYLPQLAGKDWVTGRCHRQHQGTVTVEVLARHARDLL